MNRINQKGFSVVELVLILVMVGILGFVGWRVWQANSEVVTTQNNTDAQSQQESTIPSEVARVENTQDLTVLETALDSLDLEGGMTAELENGLNY